MIDLDVIDGEALRKIQAPLKKQYREMPETALITLKAQGRLGEGITCKVETGRDWLKRGFTRQQAEPDWRFVQEICSLKHS